MMCVTPRRLQHYAGDVTYDVTDFVKKNVDSLSRDLSLVMYRCDLPLMKALFPEGEDCGQEARY